MARGLAKRWRGEGINVFSFANARNASSRFAIATFWLPKLSLSLSLSKLTWNWDGVRRIWMRIRVEGMGEGAGYGVLALAITHHLTGLHENKFHRLQMINSLPASHMSLVYLARSRSTSTSPALSIFLSALLKLASDAGATGAKLLIQLGFVCSATRDSITSDLIILAFHTKAASTAVELPTNGMVACLPGLGLAWSLELPSGLIWQGRWRTWIHSTLH